MMLTDAYHLRALVPLCLILIGANVLYGLAGFPYAVLFSIVLYCWWREGLLRVFGGLPGAKTVPLALKGLLMAFFWPVIYWKSGK